MFDAFEVPLRCQEWPRSEGGEDDVVLLVIVHESFPRKTKPLQT
jgi:hypothetical protein